MAIEWETKIKKWSVKKKEALINSDWKKLVEEAKCKNESSHEIFNLKLKIVDFSTTLEVTKGLK